MHKLQHDRADQPAPTISAQLGRDPRGDNVIDLSTAAWGKPPPYQQPQPPADPWSRMATALESIAESLASLAAVHRAANADVLWEPSEEDRRASREWMNRHSDGRSA